MGQTALPVVVIDPGHGGQATTGGSSANNATGPNGLLEKNLTLDLAQRVERALQGEATVILTRAGDNNLSLSDRARVGRDNHAAAFLSIHLNGFQDGNVDGSEVWVARNASQRSREFAQMVLRQVLAVTGVNDRGVREQDFGVLLPERHAADTATCLAEIAFLTNPAQALRLQDNDYRQRLAAALAAAVRQRVGIAAAQALAGGWRAPGENGRSGYPAGRRAGPAKALGGGMAPGPFSLSASVGDGGHNVATDVRALKERLISLGFSWLAANEVMDAPTLRTIRLFQSIVAGRTSVSGDGRVDVPGATYDWLRASNAPRWQLMPAGTAAEGFVNDELADTNDQHDYGVNWMADTIRAAAADYRSSYLGSHAGAALMTINDVSLPQGGDTPDHSGHETGLACDLKLPRSDGQAGGITHSSGNFDRPAARAQLQALRRQPLVTRILFNDPVLIAEGLCERAAGHDNHYHFEINPPAQAAGGAVAQALGQGTAAVSAEALAEATVLLAGGAGSLLRADYVQQRLGGRAANAALNAVFEAALQAGGTLADLARRVVREIERQFILDASTSSLDLLPPDQRDRYRRFAWGENDYPGGDDPPAANEGRANEMAANLSRIRPERRANRGGGAVITEEQLATWQRQGNDGARFWTYVNAEMQPVPGQAGHRLNRHALTAFNQMVSDAAADGVTLTIVDSDRTPDASRRAAASAGNRAAVARFSSHTLGLAVDFRMSHSGRAYRETTTRPMQNVVDMRESPVHKWLFLRGEAYGWYPYQHEPWHWEYNPAGFRARYFSHWTGVVPGATTQAAALDARTVSVQYDVPLVPQPDKLSCWAGAMAMMVSYRRQASFPVEELASSVGRSLRTSYGWDMLERVKDHFGFRDIPMPDNMSYVPPPEDWHAWLRQYGPLWVTVRGAPSHAVIVTGIQGDLTPAGTSVRILDPWDTTIRFDPRDRVDFIPPNYGRRAELPYTRFADEFINIDVMANVGDWRILYLPPLPAQAQGAGHEVDQALDSGSTPPQPSASVAPLDSWVLPPDVRVTGERQSIRYDDPPAWNRADCTHSFSPGGQQLRTYLLATFGGIAEIGGLYCRPNTARTSQMSVHGTGRALDIMIPTVNGRANRAIGDPIANWLVQNAAAIGVQYLIWNHTKWNGSRRGRKDGPYGGPNPHVDHIHVELNQDGAARSTPWFMNRP